MAKLTEWQEYILNLLRPTGRIRREGWWDDQKQKWLFYYEVENWNSRANHGERVNGNSVRGLVTKGVLVFDEKNSTMRVSYFVKATQAKK